MIWENSNVHLDRLFMVSEAWLSRAIPLLHTLEFASSNAVVTQSMRWWPRRPLLQSYSHMPHQSVVTVFFSFTRGPLAEQLA